MRREFTACKYVLPSNTYLLLTYLLTYLLTNFSACECTRASDFPRQRTSRHAMQVLHAATLRPPSVFDPKFEIATRSACGRALPCGCLAP